METSLIIEIVPISESTDGRDVVFGSKYAEDMISHVLLMHRFPLRVTSF